jgi:hypothetical protein
VLARYPIAHELEGWYFRVDRVAATVWRAEGTDLWGRKVSCEGSSVDVLLDCVTLAKEVRARS